MKRLLNTLYVTTDGAWLRKDGANVVVEVDRAETGRVPIHLLSGILCLGRIGVSPPLMAFCAENGVAISFCSEHGRFQARMEGPMGGNVLLRRAQHRVTADPTLSLPVACATVAAKLSNQRSVLRRAMRDHGETIPPETGACLDDAIRRLADGARNALSAADLDFLRGLEGQGSATYFAAFPAMIRRDDPELAFGGRNRRPPRDPVNALLSFLYAVLGHDCRSALETVGLDPQMGFLHRDRPGRASLALDLLEEFRAPIADRVCLTLLNRRQLSSGDFSFEPGGAVLLSEEARRTTLVAYQERKRSELVHPFLGEKVPLGLAPFLQAQLLARHLRGDLDGYPAFIWR